MGFGKPDERVYRRVLAVLGCRPDEAWSAGDNLEFDVGGRRGLGVRGIWVNAGGTSLPEGAAAQPDRVIRSIAELP